jgi:hypothetical protein
MRLYRELSIKQLIVLLGFMLLIVSPVAAQEIYEYFPEDASYLDFDIIDIENAIVQLKPGLYEMDNQLRFNKDTNIILEGSGSGLGEDATILDFTIYSNAEEDSRALGIRGGVIIRNMTIMNVRGRAADLRTGNIDAPSDDEVIFENVWFVDCNTGLKSTGGRTIGTAEKPMLVKNCVFLVTPEFPYDPSDSPLDFKDTTFALIDHCDFYNYNDMLQMNINDPIEAPNDGPGVTIKNSILLSNNGPEDDDIDISAGKLILQNSVLWDAVSGNKIDRLGDGVVEESNNIAADPLYKNVGPTIAANELDFSLLPLSPAKGASNDGRDAGSIAEEFVHVNLWQLY